MRRMLNRSIFSAFTILAALVISATGATSRERLDAPPAGFTSDSVRVQNASIHIVRGGSGPTLILVHGFPETWVEYRSIMPKLARSFTVIALDLPGIGQSGPSDNGYESVKLASRIHDLATALKLDRPYIVGHDLGGIVTYAYVRSFPQSLRGAMILDVPVPGIAGWDKSVADFWHIKFIQAPRLAEQVMPGEKTAFFTYFLAVAKFKPAEINYYIKAYGKQQLHAAFEIYRGFIEDEKWNAAQTGSNNVPLTVAVGEKSFFGSFLPTYVEGFKSKGMADVEGAQIPGASHYVLADNPDAVADLIEKSAARTAP